jgi:hypothetical protein
MKRTFTALCLAAAASWVMAAGAQTESTTEKTQKSPKKSMTFTGCVQEGATPDTYVLTNVSGSGTGSSTSGTSGTGTSGTGTSGSTMMENIELVPSGAVDLKTHVGHQVQVTGTMEKKPKSGASGSGTGTSGSGTSGSGSSTSGSGMSGQSGAHGSMSGTEHKLRVQSVKMVSETCPGR